MDIDTTPATDIVITDDAAVTEDYTNHSFGKEIAKTLIVSAATTAGMMVGAAAIGFTVTKVSEFRARRAAKKTTVVEEVVETVKDATSDTEK